MDGGGMARKRFHDPEMYRDQYFGRLSLKARLLFGGIIDHADDEGFGQGDAAFLRSSVFPYDDFTLNDIEILKTEIENCKEKSKMIEIYKVKQGGVEEVYYRLPKWFDYQPIPDYPIPSKIANLLIDIGKLDRNFNGGLHQKFCRKYAGRKHIRSIKKVKDRIGLDRGLDRKGKDTPHFLALKLKEAILKNNPKAKITDSQLSKWSEIVRLMVDRDSRTEVEIESLIEYSQADHFWKTNILSMASLRKQFDRLTLQKGVKENPRGRESNICPTCHKPMADQGDSFKCTDCRTTFKKAILKTEV